MRAGLLALVFVSLSASAGELTVGSDEVSIGGQSFTEPPQTPRTSMLEIKLGGVKPRIDSAGGLTGNPYQETFGAGSMLLFELQMDRQLWQEIGSFAVGFSAGYAEKFGFARQVGGGGELTQAEEKTGFHIVPLKALAVYRFDYFAIRNGIPLVPFVKLGPTYTSWWSTKGGGVEFFNGQRGAGARFGYQFSGGVSFLLDVLEPRLARDFDSDLGVNHSYLFAEYTHANMFGSGGMDLSMRHWMFGLALEF